MMTTETRQEFLEWLSGINKLGIYEAALDISVDYAGDQKKRLEASEFINKLIKQFLKIKNNFIPNKKVS